LSTASSGRCEAASPVTSGNRLRPIVEMAGSDPVMTGAQGARQRVPMTPFVLPLSSPQATDPDRLNRAGTDQRIHDGSSDAKPIRRFFHGKDQRQPELIKLRALPSGALSFPRMGGPRFRSAHMPNPFRRQSRCDGLHATRPGLAARPVSTLGTSTDLSITEMANQSSQKRCHSAHTRLTCG
jgi:hypothetical protein